MEELAEYLDWQECAGLRELFQDGESRLLACGAVYALGIDQNVGIEREPHELLVQLVSLPSPNLDHPLRPQAAEQSRSRFDRAGVVFLHWCDPCHRPAV